MDEAADKPEDAKPDLKKALSGMLDYHRSVVAVYANDIRHAPSESLQIVLLANILDALTAKNS